MKDPRDTAGGGAALVFGMHLLAFVLGGGAMAVIGSFDDWIGPLYLGWMFFIGVAQLVYVGPAFWWARRRGWTRLAQGLLIGAGVTFLLNAACWGLLGISV